MKINPKMSPKVTSAETSQLSRRRLVGGAAALTAAPFLTVADVFAAQAPALVSAFSDDRRKLKATRVTAAGITSTTITAETLANTTLLQFLSRKATALAVYSAPPGHSVAARKVAVEGPEFLFITKGELTLTTDNGSASCPQGAVVLLDGGAVAEKAGPRGYTAIRVRMTVA